MKKNGKEIKCKTCKVSFYGSLSRVLVKKYCSRDCALKDNFGFKPRTKPCVICQKPFTITKNIEVQKKTCSPDCWKQLNYRISKARTSEKTTKICRECFQTFTALKFRPGTGRCPRCNYKHIGSTRTGKKNPNYKDGHATKAKFGGKRGIYTVRHFAACRSYRLAFLKQHGYAYCEVCGVNEQATPRFEVHHIYYASLYPNHKFLHDFRNLIHICKQCHVDFHQGKKKDVFSRLVIERGLRELIGPPKSRLLPNS